MENQTRGTSGMICLVMLVGATASFVTACATQPADSPGKVVVDDPVVDRDLLTAARHLELRSSIGGDVVAAGARVLIIIPLVAVLLLVTIIGIPLGVVLLALYVAALVLSTAFVAFLIGGWILAWAGREHASSAVRLLIGAVLLSFAMSLPWLGWVVQAAVVLVGFGAVILERRDFRQQLRGVGLA